jgi:beta-glucosidase
VTGTYKLGINGCNQYRLYLDGEPVIELDFWYHPVTRVAKVDLEAGRCYSLRLEYVNRHVDHDAQIQLLWAVPTTDLGQQAVEAARKADVVVMVLGLSARLEGEEMPVDVPGFKGGDRIEIGLPAPQEELLRRIHALSTPMVLVLTSGSALAVSWAADNIPAIVSGWYPGEEGGTAVADVLFGDHNPAGRLPVTFYRSVGDLPPFEDYRMDGRTYRYFRGDTLYPFGYGLSYTRFAYGNLQLSTTAIALGEASPADADSPVMTVRADVQNVGQRAGDEVVQLYISDLAASVPVPLRQLAGFERVHLAPGETKTVAFAVTPRQLSLIDDAGRRIVEPGTFEIAVGGRQPGAGKAPDGGILVGTFEVVP